MTPREQWIEALAESFDAAWFDSEVGDIKINPEMPVLLGRCAIRAAEWAEKLAHMTVEAQNKIGYDGIADLPWSAALAAMREET